MSLAFWGHYRFGIIPNILRAAVSYQGVIN